MTVTLPGRPRGTPYSETFLVMSNPGGLMILRAGTRSVFTQWGPPACPVRPVVPASAPPTITAATVASGAAYLLPDPGFGGKRLSYRRFHVEFVAGTSQEVRQAVLDAANATVLGGAHVDTREGLYYVDVPLPLDSGIARRDAVWFQLLRNAAVRMVFPERSPEWLSPQGLAPNDGPRWHSWNMDSVDVSHDGWHLESDRAPLAWGCTTGSGSVPLATIDEFYTANPDVPVSVGGASGPSGSHAAAVSSILRANGNSGAGMAGVAWAGGLTFYWKGDLASPVPGDTAPAAGFELLHAIKRAVGGGARVVNISVGLNWAYVPTSLKDSLDVAGTADLVGRALKAAFLRQDSLGKPRPLVVLAAANNALDAFWSEIAAAVSTADSAAIAAQVIIVGGSAHTTQPALWYDFALQGSNVGNLLDVVAPAKDVHALVGNDVDGVVAGTSYAAPQVAGAAALALANDPSLSAAATKSAIIEGARNGGRLVLNPTASLPAKATVPALDIYEALKLVARTPGTPLCGNRIWSDGSSVWARRGATNEIIGTVPTNLFISALQPHHGGRVLGILAIDTTIYSGVAADSSRGFVLDSAGHWKPYGLLPPDSFATSISGSARSSGSAQGDSLTYARSASGRSHGGDTVIYAQLEMPTPYPYALGVTSPGFASLTFRRSTDGGATNAPFAAFTLPIAQPSTNTAVEMSYGVPPGVGTAFRLWTDVRLLRYPAMAVSPAGRYVYLAVNRRRAGITELGTTWHTNCQPYDDFGNLRTCRNGIMQFSGEGAVVLRLNLATQQLDTAFEDATRHIDWLSVSEDGREVVYAGRIAEQGSAAWGYVGQVSHYDDDPPFIWSLYDPGVNG
ncbi:MAG: S8 family serine peptidase, partial [Gemmatimonadetes bacterium]|nr:S8 family serine peptidase [Gemmatimonadota bacterium]